MNLVGWSSSRTFNVGGLPPRLTLDGPGGYTVLSGSIAFKAVGGYDVERVKSVRIVDNNWSTDDSSLQSLGLWARERCMSRYQGIGRCCAQLVASTRCRSGRCAAVYQSALHRAVSTVEGGVVGLVQAPRAVVRDDSYGLTRDWWRPSPT